MTDQDDYWTAGRVPAGPRPVPAKFDSMCPACDGRVHVDDLIVRDDEGRWVHADCPEPERSPVDLGPGEVVCRRCFIVQPCDCPPCIMCRGSKVHPFHPASGETYWARCPACNGSGVEP